MFLVLIAFVVMGSLIVVMWVLTDGMTMASVAVASLQTSEGIVRTRNTTDQFGIRIERANVRANVAGRNEWRLDCVIVLVSWQTFKTLQYNYLSFVVVMVVVVMVIAFCWRFSCGVSIVVMMVIMMFVVFMISARLVGGIAVTMRMVVRMRLVVLAMSLLVVEGERDVSQCVLMVNDMTREVVNFLTESCVGGG